MSKKRSHPLTSREAIHSSKRTTVKHVGGSSLCDSSLEKDIHAAAVNTKPSTSQATFSGLPAELRLHIYSYLCEEAIIHVHHHHQKNEEGVEQSRFTWSPCRSPSSFSPLLCANPKWSAICAEEDRCTYKIDAPPEPKGFWGLAAANKLIRTETKEFFLRKTVVSIHPRALKPWLDHLAEHDPKTLESLGRITLAGPIHNGFTIYQRQDLFGLLRDRVPNLEGVGLQCQEPSGRWQHFYNTGKINLNDYGWGAWNTVNCMKSFDASVSIAMEAIVWRKPQPWGPAYPEQHIAFRIARDGAANVPRGKAGYTQWDDTNTRIEVHHPGKLGAPKRTAKWRHWWRGKDTRGFV